MNSQESNMPKNQIQSALNHEHIQRFQSDESNQKSDFLLLSLDRSFFNLTLLYKSLIKVNIEKEKSQDRPLVDSILQDCFSQIRIGASQPESLYAKRHHIRIQSQQEKNLS
ncbi:unnamed protein product [Paramecium pentaurelia]|uniref:Uncharacterized protein n=1 Tax=Paramecium pentaurelia TaxID=43138 RepID=A0A8S1TLQ1_9CILI|nr:unnamed protein product [Paramecium pentaurelia]